MNSRTTSALAAACALAASGLSLATSYSGDQAGSYAGSPDIRSENGAIEGGANESGGEKDATENGSTAGNGEVHAYGNNGSAYETSGGASDYHDTHHANGNATTTNTAYRTDTGTTTDATGSEGGDGILAHGSGVSHQALLAGGNEVSRDGKADAGDPDGNGAASISIDPEAGKLCFAIVVNNLDAPVAAHIHQARAGQNGPVVVTLKAPERGDPGTSSGCVDNVDRLLLQAIHAHPWAYYVNVHSGAYPDGAARGQLH